MALDTRAQRAYCLGHMDRFEKIRQLRDEHEGALDEASRLRDAYHREIVKLHRSGLSLREIAEELGISHQRVHQIVAPHEDAPRGRSKRGVAAGAIVVALLLAGGGFLFGHQPAGLSRASATPSARAHPVVSCTVSRTRHPSAISPLGMSLACQRRGPVVALDPETGKILGMQAVRTRDLLIPSP